METLLTGLPNLRIKEAIRDDDSIDQLHHFVTVYLFALFAFLIGLKEFAGEPLDCYWTEQNWKHYQDHVNSYCWTHKLYEYPNLSNWSEMPYKLYKVTDPNYNGSLMQRSLDEDSLGEINFYRWVTIIFLFQAFLFKLPGLLWQECNDYSGTNIEKMVSMISSNTFDEEAKRKKVFNSVAEFLETWLKINRKPFWFMKSRVGRQAKRILRNWMLCVGANTGNFLSSMYLLVKFLFLTNCLLQFAILSMFLEFNYWHFGPHAMRTYYNTDVNIDKQHFPRVALCHFQEKGNGYWVQCLLTINMLLEKLFLLEWFWLLTLLILTICSFVAWLLRILKTQLSVKFVRKYLCLLNEDGSLPEVGEKTIQTFVVDYLGNDGVFVLRILATNSNDVAMSQLVTSIWDRYMTYENKVTVEPEVYTTPSREDVNGGGDFEMSPLREHISSSKEAPEKADSEKAEKV